jgi:hypothetical protein
MIDKLNPYMTEMLPPAKTGLGKIVPVVWAGKNRLSGSASWPTTVDTDSISAYTCDLAFLNKIRVPNRRISRSSEVIRRLRLERKLI